MENDFDLSELGPLFLYITYLNFSLQSVKNRTFEFFLKITHTLRSVSYPVTLYNNVMYEDVTGL